MGTLLIAMTPSQALLIAWLTFMVLGTCGAIATLVWAIRRRQFSDQDRARYLALQSGIPEEKR